MQKAFRGLPGFAPEQQRVNHRSSFSSAASVFLHYTCRHRKQPREGCRFKEKHTNLKYEVRITAFSLIYIWRPAKVVV